MSSLASLMSITFQKIFFFLHNLGDIYIYISTDHLLWWVKGQELVLNTQVVVYLFLFKFLCLNFIGGGLLFPPIETDHLFDPML